MVNFVELIKIIIRITSLRKPKCFRGTRDSIINIGSTKHPIWRSFKDHGDQNIELVRGQDMMSSLSSPEKIFSKTLSHFKFQNEFNNVVNNRNIETGDKSPFNMQNIKDVGQIFVKLRN